MSRAARRGKSEAQLHELERQFVCELVAELRACAAGRWGIFGQNDPVVEGQPAVLRRSLTSAVSRRMSEASDNIQRLRRELGIAEGFYPLERYEHYRQMRSPNSAGEPRLAAQLLAELENPRSYSG